MSGHIQNLLSHLHNEENARQRVTALVYPLMQIRRRHAEEESETGARRARVELTQEEEVPPEIIQLSSEANIEEPQRGGNRILPAQENLEEEEEEEQEQETADEEREEEVREEQVEEETEEEEEEEREQARVAQNAGGLDIAQNFNVFSMSTAPRGRERVSNKLTREDVAKRSILTISNLDNLCFPCSLIITQIYHERGTLRAGELHKRWNMVKRQNSSLQRDLAQDLTRRAGVTITPEGCGIQEIEYFQRFLAASDIAIIV
ncbi:ribosomal biogenesis protein LAS1L-like [Pogonomyrmex barbatus]|uniref:Ribosomal biogenesis protein LAS1L-like n=1 Tax=Pogonomyrmex barbatus TaxID=144034 RepID=A0A8N1S2V0_9HYME|nr:ribosomal biogenesis protein LAS1L-like [Pogonomyrmex barbatus]